MHKERILESSTAPSVSTTVNVPVGWSEFSLTKFFSILEQQAFATFVNRVDDIRPILLFEEAFSARMPEIFHGGGRDEHLAMVLFARMLSAQTGAARLLFAGQVMRLRRCCVRRLNAVYMAVLSDMTRACARPGTTVEKATQRGRVAGTHLLGMP